MAQQHMTREDRSLGELFTELAANTGTLVRQEVALAQAEVTHKVAKAGKNVGSLVIGGAVAYLAVMSLTAALIIGLAAFMPAWLSALIVGAIFGAVSYFLISSALTELRNTDPMPRETIETIKEDAQWLKNEMK
jgi:uncharacterized membrane protein YqjE